MNVSKSDDANKWEIIPLSEIKIFSNLNQKIYFSLIVE